MKRYLLVIAMLVLCFSSAWADPIRSQPDCTIQEEAPVTPELRAEYQQARTEFLEAVKAFQSRASEPVSMRLLADMKAGLSLASEIVNEYSQKDITEQDKLTLGKRYVGAMNLLAAATGIYCKHIRAVNDDVDCAIDKLKEPRFQALLQEDLDALNAQLVPVNAIVDLVSSAYEKLFLFQGSIRFVAYGWIRDGRIQADAEGNPVMDDEAVAQELMLEAALLSLRLEAGSEPGDAPVDDSFEE